MSQLSEIIAGWGNFVFRNEKVEQLAINRTAICLDCDKLKENKRCAICGCFIPAKVRSENSNCPLKKW